VVRVGAEPVSAAAPAEVLTRGVAALRGLLPVGWVVEVAAAPVADSPTVGDAVISVAEPRGRSGSILVAVRGGVAPRDVGTLFGGRSPLPASDPSAPVAVFAPWVSPRSRVLLAERNIGYLDLTGNVRLHLDRPAVVLRTAGAELDPDPPRRGSVSVRGTIAGRVVRLLADVQPPYTASGIGAAAGVSVPYVSRLLGALDREALIRRGPRSLVVDVDWVDLLRRRAETYRLFDTNGAHGYLSGTGPRDVVDRLRTGQVPYRAVTGSFAAVQRAPVAAPGQLTVYVDDPAATADELGLLPADTGADVVLLTAYDVAVFDRAEVVDGLRVVAPSQLAVDCLAGNGRMPAEGEALLGWMAADETRWRRPGLAEIAPRVGAGR